MLLEGIKNKDGDDEKPPVGFTGLVVQGIATSIDALSEGLTIAEYSLPCALLSALIIAAETFVICLAGIMIGRKFGTRLAGRAAILGGAIYIDSVSTYSNIIDANFTDNSAVLGGAIYMNAGAYLKDISDVLLFVKVLDLKDMKIKRGIWRV